jgi:hypothetical protein
MTELKLDDFPDIYETGLLYLNCRDRTSEIPNYIVRRPVPFSGARCLWSAGVSLRLSVRCGVITPWLLAFCFALSLLFASKYGYKETSKNAAVGNACKHKHVRMLSAHGSENSLVWIRSSPKGAGFERACRPTIFPEQNVLPLSSVKREMTIFVGPLPKN